MSRKPRFATYYLMTDKAMNSLVHLEDIQAGLPNPSCFLDQGCLGGLTPSHYTHILRVHGFVVHEELRMTRSNDYLGIILRRMLKSGRLEPGAKFLLDVEQSHLIAVKILHGGKIVLVDQVTSCFFHEMFTNQRFSKWYYCENFVLLRVLPTPGNPSSRLRAAVHEALETEASMRRVARKVESALKVVTDLRKHGSWEYPRPHKSKFHPAYSELSRMQTWLAIVKHQAGARKRLAEDAGAVFEPRRRARITPRAPGAGRRTGIGALQRLVLDRSRTARALAEREAAWAAQAVVKKDHHQGRGDPS